MLVALLVPGRSNIWKLKQCRRYWHARALRELDVYGSVAQKK